jgi:hypothetical protein
MPSALLESNLFKKPYVCVGLSAAQLWMKTGRMSCIERWKGHSDFLLKLRECANEVGQNIIPIAIGMILPVLQGEHMRQKSLADDEVTEKVPL